MKFNNFPIGIFDSGLGGLTVFKEIRKILPYEDLIYFGDTARVPYGNKSKNTVIRYSNEILEFLIGKGVKIVIVACNTSSSLALDSLRERAVVPVFGVIGPGAKKAVQVFSGRNIAVIGTAATIKSRAYSRAINQEIEHLDKGRIDHKFKIIEQACPLFVPLVEEDFSSEEIIRNIISYYLNPIVGKKPSCMVLGCTHYPILKDFILEVMGMNVEIIDSGIETAKVVKRYLGENGMLKDRKEIGSESFFVSDGTGRLKDLGEKFLGINIRIEDIHVVEDVSLREVRI